MLSQSEQIVRKAIQESDVPFLGLLAETFTTPIKIDIEIAVLANPTVHGYISYLQRYPSLFSVNLTAHIMKGMGNAGHFELYPHIQKAIGIDSELSTIDREKLWRAFRQAVLTLGLEPSPRVSGTHFMVDEYLRQVGVPLAFVDDLAERMLTFAKRVGLPDEDDPEAVTSWQVALDAKLEQPFSRTARKAVALDSQGFYTQVFLRVHAHDKQGEGLSNALERGMARALQRQSSSVFRRAVLPYLILHEGNIGIFIAGEDERKFEFEVDGVSRTFSAGVEDKFISINESLPKDVVIKEVSGRQSSRYLLWEDNRPNRLLVFSDTGRFSARAHLNQSEPLVLSPGNYTFLSRFQPAEVEAEELWNDPKQYIFSVFVHPGAQIDLTHGPAKLTVQGESQPFVSWQGQSKSTKEGLDFFFGPLDLTIEFPTEWLAAAGSTYVLRLTINGCNERLERQFNLDDAGRVVFDISAEAKKQSWRPGFGRLLAEVYRPGENRILLRGAAFYWYGLNTISN